MQDESTPKESPDENQVTPPAESGIEPGPVAEPGLDELRQQLAEAEAKASDNWDRCLRATAEQDNIRKRAEREIEAARRFALEKFAHDLLAVCDSLELGVKSAQEAGADAKYVEGTELTLKLFVDVLNRHGIQVIAPQGESFDPELHEAITAIPTADAAPNTVIEVMQKGYSLNDRVLRPAMVAVAKAPPSEAP